MQGLYRSSRCIDGKLCRARIYEHDPTGEPTGEEMARDDPSKRGRFHPGAEKRDRAGREQASKLRVVLGFPVVRPSRAHNRLFHPSKLTRPPVRGMVLGTREVQEDKHGKDRDSNNQPGCRCFDDG